MDQAGQHRGDSDPKRNVGGRQEGGAAPADDLSSGPNSKADGASWGLAGRRNRQKEHATAGNGDLEYIHDGQDKQYLA